MPLARTLALLFASILLLFTVFWFLTPSHFLSLLHFHGLDRALAFLENKRNNSTVESFTHGKALYSNQDFHELKLGYFPFHLNKSTYLATTRNAQYSNEKHISEAPHYLDTKEVDISNSILDPIEAHAGKWSQIPKNEKYSNQNSKNSKEAASFLGDKHYYVLSPSISHKQYSDKVLIFKVPRMVEGKPCGKAVSFIPSDVPYVSAEKNYGHGKVLDVARTPIGPRIIKMDSNGDFQSFEASRIIELESDDHGTTVYINDAFSKVDLNFVEVLNENKMYTSQMNQGMEIVLDEALPDMEQEINETASNRVFESFEVLPYHKVNGDDAVSLSSGPAQYIDKNVEITGTLNEKSDQHLDNIDSIHNNTSVLVDEIEEFHGEIQPSMVLKEIGLRSEIELNIPPDEMDVLVLSKKNFSDFVSENKYVVVNFYMPRSYWSKEGLDYAAAATMLRGKVLFAKVDATQEKELARTYRFPGYPTLYFFISGVHMHTYRYCCRRDAVATWVKGKMNGGIKNITSTSDALYISMSDSIIILGFLDTLEGPESEEFAAASKLEKYVIFYQTANKFVARMLQIDHKVQRPALFIMRKDAGKFIHFNGPFTVSAIADFVSMNKFPLVTTFNAQTALPILTNPMKQLWLFALDDDLDKVVSVFQEAAKAFNGKLLFVYIKMDHKDVGKRLSYEIGVPRNEPKVIAYTKAEGVMKYAMDGEMSLSNIKLFGEDFLEDKQLGEPLPPSGWLFERLLSW